MTSTDDLVDAVSSSCAHTLNLTSDFLPRIMCSPARFVEIEILQGMFVVSTYGRIVLIPRASAVFAIGYYSAPRTWASWRPSGEEATGTVSFGTWRRMP